MAKTNAEVFESVLVQNNKDRKEVVKKVLAIFTKTKQLKNSRGFEITKEKLLSQLGAILKCVQDKRLRWKNYTKNETENLLQLIKIKPLNVA